MNITPKDYHYRFTHQGINYYVGVVPSDIYELKCVKQDPITKEWDKIVANWSGMEYDLENRWPPMAMLEAFILTVNKRLELSTGGDKESIPEAWPELVKEIAALIQESLEFDMVNGLTIRK